MLDLLVLPTHKFWCTSLCSTSELLTRKQQVVAPNLCVAAPFVHLHERRYMTDAYHQIGKIAADHKVPLRVAAFLLAVKRVAQAEQHRGFD